MKLGLFGFGGHAKVVYDAAIASGYVVAALADDDPAKHGDVWGGVTISGRVQVADAWLITVGSINPRGACLRQRIADSLRASFGTVIHPTAVVSPCARIEHGTFIAPLAVVNANATIGRHVIVNSGAIVEHDCTVGDYVHIAPRAVIGGDTRIGAYTHVGIGATVRQGLSIGRHALIAAGAVVVRDVPDGATMMGVPAHASAVLAI